jgi:hypothetical protein
VAQALVGVLVGAFLTMLGQWVLGPRVERRVRAQERWEQFLIEFASLLEGPVKHAQDAARSAWFGWSAWYELAAEEGAELESDQVQELIRSDRDQFREALEVWRDSLIRPDWLARRISGDYRVADEDVRSFARTWQMHYRFLQLRWVVWHDGPREAASDWSEVTEAHRAVVAAVETLSARIGAPVGAQQRLRARWRQYRETRREAKRRATVKGQ